MAISISIILIQNCLNLLVIVTKYNVNVRFRILVYSFTMLMKLPLLATLLLATQLVYGAVIPRFSSSGVDGGSAMRYLSIPPDKRVIFDPDCVGEFNLPLYRKLGSVCMDCSYIFGDYMAEECRYGNH